MDWRALRADLASHPGARLVLGDILEPPRESVSPDGRELTARQWAAVRARCEEEGEDERARSLPHGAKIPTLISSRRGRVEISRRNPISTVAASADHPRRGRGATATPPPRKSFTE